MSDAKRPNEGEMIFYNSPTGKAKVEVLFVGETFWLPCQFAAGDSVSHLGGPDVARVHCQGVRP